MKCFRVALRVEQVGFVLRIARGPIELLLHDTLIVGEKRPLIVIEANDVKFLCEGLIYSGFGFVRTLCGEERGGQVPVSVRARSDANCLLEFQNRVIELAQIVEGGSSFMMSDYIVGICLRQQLEGLQ